LLTGQIGASAFQFGRASATLTYEMEILGPNGSVPILIDVSGAVNAHVGLDGSATALAQSSWSFEDVSLGPVFSDALDSGVRHDDFSQNFSHTVFVTVTANHIHRVTMSRVVKKLDLFESNHSCGLNVPSQGRDPKRT
jgi:hypothetical protein